MPMTGTRVPANQNQRDSTYGARLADQKAAAQINKNKTTALTTATIGKCEESG